MEDNNMPPEEWMEVLSEAYRSDKASKDAMDIFNHRINTLKAEGSKVETDCEANLLYADLVLAVRAFLEGKVMAGKNKTQSH